MQWIKYKIICNENENILLDKRVGYSDANLAIAQAEAYNGEYIVEDDGKDYGKNPIPIEHGGTGANNAEGAVANLGVAKKSHASTDASYGMGSGSEYGHVKLSDSLTSQDGVSSGKAATPYAVKQVYDYAQGRAPASHGNHVPTKEDADNAKFLRNDNTWAAVTPANIGAAPTSHGNHVPAVEAASKKKFLRNDNTWQDVTPENIGAAPAYSCGTSDPGAGSLLTTGKLYFVYE